MSSNIIRAYYHRISASSEAVPAISGKSGKIRFRQFLGRILSISAQPFIAKKIIETAVRVSKQDYLSLLYFYIQHLHLSANTRNIVFDYTHILRVPF